MNTPLPNPALAAVGPASPTQPVSTLPVVLGSPARFSEKVNSVLFYGLLAFGVGFPIVATIYAIIVF